MWSSSRTVVLFVGLLCLIALGSCSGLSMRSEDFLAKNSTDILELLPPTAWYHVPSDESMYTETWNLVAAFDSGEILYLQFLSTNIGVTSGSLAVSASYTDAEGEMTFFGQDYSPDELAQDEAAGTLAMGPVDTITIGEDQVHVAAVIEALDVHLTITPLAPPVAFKPKGRVALDDKDDAYFAIEFLVPHGTIEGTIATGPGTSHAVTGKVTIDKNHSNVDTSAFATQWLLVRNLGPSWSVIVGVLQTSESFGTTQLGRALVAGPGVLMGFDGVTVGPGGEVQDPDGYSYPTTYSLGAASPDGAVSGAIGETKVHHRFVVFDSLSWAIRTVLKLFAGNPIIYRSTASSALQVTPQGEAPVSVGGKTLVEYIVIREATTSLK